MTLGNDLIHFRYCEHNMAVVDDVMYCQGMDLKMVFAENDFPQAHYH